MQVMVDQQAWLSLARAWKRGELRPVHPSVGQVLNAALSCAGEDCVPFRRSTDSREPSLAELVQREYLCASAATSDAHMAFLRRVSERSERRRAS